MFTMLVWVVRIFQWKYSIYITFVGGKDLLMEVQSLYELRDGFTLCGYGSII